MACPVCQSKQFYVKDPQDEYELFEFGTQGGQVQFDDPQAADAAPAVTGEQEIFCRRCSWHGPFERAEKG